ncbi:hypothetical protein MKX01_033171, partial [Papaver californicum]
MKSGERRCWWLLLLFLALVNAYKKPVFVHGSEEQNLLIETQFSGFHQNNSNVDVAGGDHANVTNSAFDETTVTTNNNKNSGYGGGGGCGKGSGHGGK